MKYWVFDGNDVVGPFALQEIAARADFSASTLICAEDTSEDAAGWQMASFFDAFRFHPQTGQLEVVVLPDGSSLRVGDVPPAATAAKEMTLFEAEMNKSAAQTSSDLPDVRNSKVTPEKAPAHEPLAQEISAQKPLAEEAIQPEKKLHTQPPTPVTLAHENVELVLPEKTAPQAAATPQASASQTPAVSPGQEQPAEIPVSEGAASPAQPVLSTPASSQTSTTDLPTNKQSPYQSSLATPETEILSTCTLPIINDVLTQSDLPCLPEGGFQSVPLPAEPSFDLQEFVPEDASPQKTPARQEEPQPFGAEELVTAQVPPEKVYPAPQRPHEETISEIKKEFAPRPEQEDLLLEQQLLAKPTRRKAHAALWVLLVLVLVGAGWLVWNKQARFLGRIVPLKPTATQAAAPAVPEAEETPAPVVTPVVPPAPVTAEEKALAAVQNYQLPQNQGTIAAYFDRVYQERLAQGYTAHWSVEPLHKNTYIVKYRLTKPRTEPVVYVFQADAARGKLTGALNNIALDLVGRI